MKNLNFYLQIFLYPFILLFSLINGEFALYRSYQNQRYLVPNYFKFVWLRTYGDEISTRFVQLPEDASRNKLNVTQEVKDVFDTCQVIAINGQLWLRKEVSMRISADMARDLFNAAQTAEHELTRQTTLIESLTETAAEQNEQISNQRELIRIKSELLEATQAQVRAANEALIERDKYIGTLEALVSKHADQCMAYEHQLAGAELEIDKLKNPSKYMTVVDLNPLTERVLEGLESAQGILAAHILPNSDATHEQAITALYGVLDDQELVVAQRALKEAIKEVV
jgi:hypothetical protein